MLNVTLKQDKGVSHFGAFSINAQSIINREWCFHSLFYYPAIVDDSNNPLTVTYFSETPIGTETVEVTLKQTEAKSHCFMY